MRHDGPTSDGAPTSDEPGVDAARVRLAVLVRRLRAWSGPGTAQPGHVDAVRRLVAGLAVITAPGRAAPDVPPHAWADVVIVLANDALDSGGHAGDVRRLVDEALDATR